MPRGKNQYKPLPTLDIIGPHILHYWKMKKTDKQILHAIRTKHLDLEKYGIGLTRFKELREQMGLIRTRKQDHSVESIQPAMQRLRAQYPNAGVREIISLLFHEENMLVARSVVLSYFAIYEADLVRQRKANRLKRKRFWAAGVNDIWSIDQHDKWKYKFGLALHIAVEPFVGRSQWLKVWWTNSDPRLILSYYLETVEELGFMPLVSQSDPGFETILDLGVNKGWYSPDDHLEAMVFRWVFIPWLQRELNAFRDRFNNTIKRADKNKILPHGVPNEMYESPEDFGVLDFKINVEREAITQVRELYTPSDHPVFELVPSMFAKLAFEFYQDLGEPTITRANVWDIYLSLRSSFHRLEDIPAQVYVQWCQLITIARRDIPERLELIPNLSDLPDVLREDGTYYMGGVNDGNGLGQAQLDKLDAMEAADEPALYNDSLDAQPELIVKYSSDEGEENDDEW